MAAVSGQGRDVHEAQDPLSSYISHPARDGGRGCGPCAAAAVGTWSIRLRRAQWQGLPVVRLGACALRACTSACHSCVRAQVGVLARGAVSSRREARLHHAFVVSTSLSGWRRGPQSSAPSGFGRTALLLPRAAGPHPKEGVASSSPHGPGPLGDMHTSQNSAASSPYRVPTSLASSCQEILRESDTHRRASAGHPPAVGP